MTDAPTFPHTTEDLAREAHVGPEQVLRWWRAGLLEGTGEPSRQGGPGQGVRYCWTEQTLERIRLIVKLKHEHNMSHARILAHLEQNLGVVKKKRAPKKRARGAG